MKKILFLLSFALCCVSFSHGQEYMDEDALFMNLVKQVRSPEFKLEDYGKFYETVHLNRENRKVSIKTLPPSKKVLSRNELFKQNRPHVYRFVRVFLNSQGARMIENIGTAFPISEDGYFSLNEHMTALWDAGSGDPEAANREHYYFLADYDGNIVPIDSVCTYNAKADVAIVKADTKGKKITAFRLGNDLDVGEDVFIIAHPRAYLYYFSTGMINRMLQKGDNIYSRKMEISADYAGGSSGGPIFDNKGNITGMVSLTQSFYYDQKNYKNLQMVVKQAIPVSVIKAFIN